MSAFEQVELKHLEQYRQWQEHEARMRQEEADWRTSVREEDRRWKRRTLAISVCAIVVSIVAAVGMICK